VLFGGASDLLPTGSDNKVDIQQAVIEEMSKGSTAAAPDAEQCPICGLDEFDVEEALGLSFPARFVCRCRNCKHEWDRVDD
jgi:hypothetical protein